MFLAEASGHSNSLAWACSSLTADKHLSADKQGEKQTAGLLAVFVITSCWDTHRLLLHIFYRFCSVGKDFQDNWALWPSTISYFQLDHSTKWHVKSFLKHCWVWQHHFSGQVMPVLDNPASMKKFFLMSNLNVPWCRLRLCPCRRGNPTPPGHSLLPGTCREW